MGVCHHVGQCACVYAFLLCLMFSHNHYQGSCRVVKRFVYGSDEHSMTKRKSFSNPTGVCVCVCVCV